MSGKIYKNACGKLKHGEYGRISRVYIKHL